MTKNRILQDIPELVVRLRAEKARERDLLVPQGAIEAEVAEFAGEGETGPSLSVITAKGTEKFLIMPQVHGQLAGKQDIPKKYYDRMAMGDAKDQALWAANLNHWLHKEPKKRRFIRLVDDQVRGFLGTRYRPISHLDLLTSIVQVISGQINEGPGWAKGARCFNWKLDPMKMDVEFVNPLITLDLDNLDKGVQFHEPKDVPQNDDGHMWLRPEGQQGGPGGGHLVMPTMRVRNSETGFGLMTLNGGLYEAICANTSHVGIGMSQIHVGKELTEGDIWSADTLRKISEVIFAKVIDLTRSMFEPGQLLKVAMKFKGLETEEVDAKEAANLVMELPGMNEGVRDEILEAYYSHTKHRDNMFDFQRAVTGAAHAFRADKPEVATALEELGGAIIEKGKKALVKV